MTVRRIGRYVVASKINRVYLVDDTVSSDSDLTPDQAISLGEALLLAAREAVRFTPRQTRLLHPHEPLCGCAGAGAWSVTDDPGKEDV